MGKPIIYTLTTCSACLQLKEDWKSQGREFEERRVDKSQQWLDEATKYSDQVPIVVYEDGRVEVGYTGVVN